MGLRDWVLDKGSDILGKRTYSWKTKAVGVGLILTGIVGIVGKIWGDPRLPQMGWDEIIYSISGGLAALGIGAKVEKAREENRILTQKILQSNNTLMCQQRIEKDTGISMTPPDTGGTPEQNQDSSAKKWDGVNKTGFGQDLFGQGRGN